jgi:hypothetical protein
MRLDGESGVMIEIVSCCDWIVADDGGKFRSDLPLNSLSDLSMCFHRSQFVPIRKILRDHMY